jgi:hypothetical protein
MSHVERLQRIGDLAALEMSYHVPRDGPTVGQGLALAGALGDPVLAYVADAKLDEHPGDVGGGGLRHGHEFDAGRVAARALGGPCDAGAHVFQAALQF